MEKLITPSFDSQLFPIFQNVLRQHFKDYSADKVEKTIILNGNQKHKFKFVVEWQDEIQNCFDVYHVIDNA